MIESRVIELLRNPQQITAQDLKVVSTEIGKYPYVQSLRALYLLGTHLHDKDHYQEVLHTTAAYTTDKKILYHFITKKSELGQSPKPIQDTSAPFAESTLSQTSYDEVLPREKRELPMVYVNGERNRILYEGEESLGDAIMSEGAASEPKNAAPEPTLKMANGNDLESVTKTVPDSGTPTLMDHKSHEQTETKDTPDNSKLSEIHSEDLSFQDVDAFLPQVTMPLSEKPNAFLPKQDNDRHQNEMQKLIAQVEAKIKAKKQLQEKEESAKESISEPEYESQELDFAQVSDFTVSSGAGEISSPDQVRDSHGSDRNSDTELRADDEEEPVRIQRKWSPMVIPALQGSPSKADVTEEELVVEEKAPLESEELLHVEEQKTNDTHSKSLPTGDVEEPSNVTAFINTWQSWLKIDRSNLVPSDHTTLPSIEQVRNKAIDIFIENQPKISKLKEDSSYAIKEKPDDISHLMTETLVGLYVEQRLYSKAIEGYEVLQQKHPEKFKVYSEKIEEIRSRK